MPADGHTQQEPKFTDGKDEKTGDWMCDET